MKVLFSGSLIGSQLSFTPGEVPGFLKLVLEKHFCHSTAEVKAWQVQETQGVHYGLNPAMIAQVAHEINQAYCVSIGDPVPPSWDKCTQQHKEGLIKGVNFHLENPDATPSSSHESWLQQKEADGWQYGPEKDEANKLHPNMVPYDALPAAQKSKDFLFRQVVHSLKQFMAEPQALKTEVSA